MRGHYLKQTRTRYQADFACAHQEEKRLKPETRLVDKEEDGVSSSWLKIPNYHSLL